MNDMTHHIYAEILPHKKNILKCEKSQIHNSLTTKSVTFTHVYFMIFYEVKHEIRRRKYWLYSIRVLCINNDLKMVKIKNITKSKFTYKTAKFNGNEMWGFYSSIKKVCVLATNLRSSHEQCWSRRNSCHCWRTSETTTSQTSRLEPWRVYARSSAAHWGMCSNADADKSINSKQPLRRILS